MTYIQNSIIILNPPVTLKRGQGYTKWYAQVKQNRGHVKPAPPAQRKQTNSNYTYVFAKLGDECANSAP